MPMLPLNKNPNLLTGQSVKTENHVLKVKSLRKLTPDVLSIVTDKPPGFNFVPGQATHIAINKSGWLTKDKPFTFTNLPGEDSLEFTIKTYPKHEGLTNELLALKENDELLLKGVFGTILYKGEGVFIAGGAGITPFISILRDLKSQNEIGANMLIYANKTKADIILENELYDLLSDAFISILSDEKLDGYPHGRISEAFLESKISDYNQPFYLCGPPTMVQDIEGQLIRLGAKQSSIVKEQF
jgi:ferredoxin-NADP reductase